MGSLSRLTAGVGEYIFLIVNNNPGEALRRRTEILRLVRGGAVRSQAGLRSLLLGRGFEVAQPTLSRDLRELGLARTPTGYAAPAEPGAWAKPASRADALDRVLGQMVLAVQAAGALVIVKTPPAGAHPVARAIDEAALDGVAGTIAGDDTIFVATPDAASARRVERRLRLPLRAVRRA
jgi:transcriptional regulator of arginine metabolism